MKTYVMRKVPARVTTFTDDGPEEKASDVMLIFTPDDEAGYPLGVGIEALNVLVVLPMEQLIEKIKNDLKGGEL